MENTAKTPLTKQEREQLSGPFGTWPTSFVEL